MCFVCLEYAVTRTVSSGSEPACSVVPPPKPPTRIYQQRAYTSEDLNSALKQAYQAVEEADRIVRKSFFCLSIVFLVARVRRFPNVRLCHMFRVCPAVHTY